MGKVQNANKQRMNAQRQDFLLTFFDYPYKYQEKEVNGFILVCHIDNSVVPSRWQVAIYPKEHFTGVQEYKKGWKE